MSHGDDERAWDEGWEGHSLAQLRRMARLPLGEKLAWLEEAQRLALRLRRSDGGAHDRPDDPRGPGAPD